MFDELIENPTPRCACMLLLDTSASMEGDPIAELNSGVQQFLKETRADEFTACTLEVGVVTFGGRVQEITPVQGVTDLVVPNLQANGNTPMGQAVELALDRLDRRKQDYKRAGVSYYQPWLVLMSDGAPNDAWEGAAGNCRQAAVERRLNAFAIGIGPRADLDILGRFTPPHRPALRLAGLRFGEFFTWLSQSMAAVSQSTVGTSTPLPSVSGWAEIDT